MDKFLQQFKDNLENQPAPEFDEQDWTDMQQRLNQQAMVQPKSVNCWAWAAILLLLGIIGSNWLVMQELKKANNRISQLEVNRDTILKTRIVYRTDTIFQTIDGQFISKSTQNVLTNNNIFNEQITTVSSSSLEKSKGTISSNSLQKSQKKIYSTLPREQRRMASIEMATIQKESILQTPHLKSPLIIPNNNNLVETTTGVAKQNHELPILNQLSPLNKQLLILKKRPLPLGFETLTVYTKKKKTIQQYIYPMRPRGIAIGLNYSKGATFEDFYDRLEINQWGIIAQIKFTPPFSLWVAGDHTDLDYETKTMGDKYGVPMIPSPTDNLEFEEAKIQREIWSLSMGGQYNFRPSKQWQPFIGAGYGFSNLTQNKIQYEFKQDLMGGNQVFSINEQVVYDKEQNLPYVVFKSGLNYDLNKKWRLQLEGEYLYRIADFNNQLPNILSGRLGLLYSF